MAKDGGPAFPNHNDPDRRGMSLRDWFAGQALEGMLSCQDFMNQLCNSIESKEDARKELSRLAYAQADDMIAERERFREGGPAA